MVEEERLTLREAADALGISEVSARRWVKSGKLRAFQPGRKYLIPASAVEELLRPKAPSPSLPESLLRTRTGHRYLTHSLAETVAFAEGASQDEIRTRLRDLSEELGLLREALRHLTEYVPELFRPPLRGKALPLARNIEEVKAAREEIKAVAKGFGVRVMNLAEIGGPDLEPEVKQLLAEAERLRLAAEVPA